MATAKRKAYLQEYRDKNRTLLAEKDRAKYKANKLHVQEVQAAYRIANANAINTQKAAYRQANQSKLREVDRQYYEANRTYLAEKRKEYRVKNAAQINASNRYRRLSKLQRTPHWLTRDDLWLMQEAYLLAKLRTQLFGFEWHVDHIIPLRGRMVSGLHTPLNLQVIPGVENCRKSNR